MPEHTDSHDPFSHFDPEVPMALPASEIRRRGDRLRRRNTGLAIAGGVAAVALVVAPLAVLTGGDDQAIAPADTPTVAVPTVTDPVDADDPAPSETPNRELRTTVPDDFPLDAGLPDTNEDLSPVRVVDSLSESRFSLCQGEPFRPQGQSDLAAVDFLAPEDFRGRVLAVWDDEAGATSALTQVREALTSCAATGARYVEQTSSYDGDSAVFAVEYSAFGDFAQGDELAIGLGVIEAVRVRNALYLARYDGEGGGSPEATAAGVANATDESAVVMSAVEAVFGVPDGNDAPVAAGDVRLLTPADLPDRDRVGAWAEDPDDTVTWACGAADLFTGLDAEASAAVRYAAPGADDEGGPAIARVRSAVLTFAPEDDAAERAYDALQDNLAFCADEDDRIESLDIGTYLQDLGDDATWEGFTYAATDICTDCDAAWFDRMGVARMGDQVVVVSYAEVGGPLQPEGLDQAFLDVLQQAVDLA